MRTAVSGDRVLRAAVFAGASVSLGAAAHAAGGGMGPSIPVLVGASLLLLRLGYGLTAVERGRWSVLAAVGLAQLALHTAFALAAPACMGGVSTGLPMLAAHACAALLVAALLRRADAALWAAARVLAVAGRLLVAAKAVPAPPACGTRPVVVAAAPAGPLRSALLVRAYPRRGPPAGSVFALSAR